MSKKRLVRIGIIIGVLILAELLLIGVPRIKFYFDQRGEILEGDTQDASSSGEAGEEGTEATEASSEDEGGTSDFNPGDYPDSDHLTLGLRGTNPTLVKEGDPYIESGAFCIDDRSGAVKTLSTEGTVDTSKAGDYKVKYTFESENAMGVIERTVRVVPAEEFQEKEDGLAVFMYHYVYTEEDMPDEINSNYILDSELEKQLAWLRDNQFYFPSFAEVRAFVEGRLSLPKNSCVLTFDDGQRGFLEYGIPLLEKYEIPAVSFLIVSYDAEGIMKNYASPYIAFESHSYDMHRAGGYIGHGGVISALTKEEIQEDLKKAADILGTSAAFAYPYGDYTDEAREAVMNVGILCSFTTEWEWVRVGDDPSMLPRVRIIGDAGLDAFIGSM
ncbi:MAG: polysaccharide deacetylase family protein [Firmicutes bacterium]|nr:polysaccharide deacetylase family protein [Bacillota bacterium]